MRSWTMVGLATVAVAVLGAGATVALARGGEPVRAGAGARSAEVAFLAGVLRQLAANDYAAAYGTLVEAQRRLVPLSDYTACEAQSPVPGRLSRLRAVAVRDEPVRVPGASGSPVPSTAVDFELRIEGEGAAQTPVVVRLTAHALRLDGRLAWMLSAARLDLHTSGFCGAPVRMGDPADAL